VSALPRPLSPGGTTTAGHVLDGLIGGRQSLGNPPEHGLSMEINDAKSQILWVQLFDGANKPFTFNAWSVSSGRPVGVPVPADRVDTDERTPDVSQICTMQSRVPLPRDGQLVLYLATDRNVKTFPFTLEVDLP